jgi:signal transduction histidine kinase
VFGWFLIAAGVAWFLPEWNSPAAAGSIVFTFGLIGYAAAPALLAHALMLDARIGDRRAWRALVVLGYAGSVFLGVLGAVVFDPAGQGCNSCPANLIELAASGPVYRFVGRAGIYIGLVWSACAVAWLTASAYRSRSGARRPGAVTAAGCLALAPVLAEFAASVGRGYLGMGSLDRALWTAQACGLLLLCCACAWTWLRGPLVRARLARAVVAIAQAPRSGALQETLARVLGDPTLRLAFPLHDGRVVDHSGRLVEDFPTATSLIRDSEPIAFVAHRPGLIDRPAVAEEMAATVRLALDNERLRAELLAQLSDLRESRDRIVATSDRERRTLERNLHDGAQQRLVALRIELQLARLMTQESHAGQSAPDVLGQAEELLGAALDDLRRIGAGVFPAALAEDGFAAAVEALAEETGGVLLAERLPDRRMPAAVETAAYHLVAATVAAGETVSLRADAAGGILTLELASDKPPQRVHELEDRIYALDGTLEIHSNDGAFAVRAVIPCGS